MYQLIWKPLVVGVISVIRDNALTSLYSCAAWYNIDNWLALFSVLVVFSESHPTSYLEKTPVDPCYAVMLLLRTWALWNRSRTVLICLSLLLFVRPNPANIIFTTPIALILNPTAMHFVCRGSDPVWLAHQCVSSADMVALTLIHILDVPDSLLTCGSTVPDGNVFYAVWISILVWDCGETPHLRVLC